jgi:hypothetical protein
VTLLAESALIHSLGTNVSALLARRTPSYSLARMRLAQASDALYYQAKAKIARTTGLTTTKRHQVEAHPQSQNSRRVPRRKIN